MTFDQLRIFVAVARREHVTRGARDLHLTQSATSAAVAALEARYGTKLFDRIGRRVVLTESGRIFLAEAEAVLATAHAAEEVLLDLAGLRRGTVRIAGSQTVANYWLPPLLARFRRANPGIRLEMTIGNTETVAHLVAEGLADLGVVEGDVTDASISAREIATDELVLVVPPRHSWSDKPPADAQALVGAEWVVREPGSGTRAILESVLSGGGLSVSDLHVSLQLPSNEAVVAAVIAGAGAAILSRAIVGSSLELGLVNEVDFRLPRRSFYLLRHKQRYVSFAHSALADNITSREAARSAWDVNQ